MSDKPNQENNESNPNNTPDIYVSLTDGSWGSMEDAVVLIHQNPSEIPENVHLDLESGDISSLHNDIEEGHIEGRSYLISDLLKLRDLVEPLRADGFSEKEKMDTFKEAIDKLNLWY